MLQPQDASPAAATPAEGPFVLRMPGTFWWTVRVPVPADDTYQVCKLELLFKPVSQTRLDTFRGLNLQPGQAVPSEREICHEVVAGWRNLADEEGVVHRFSAQALDQLLEVPVVRGAILATYLLVMSGMGPRKNA